MSTQPTRSYLEELGNQSVPVATEIAGRFKPTVHPNPTPLEAKIKILKDLKFGQMFSDYMARAVWTPETGWTQKVIQPYGPIQLSPAAAVLHYGQEVFEGLKAYRHADGSIWSFRPGFNAARFNASARRMAMPELPVEDFLSSIIDTVRADPTWVPETNGSSLYLRPFMFASEAFLGVHSAKEITYLMIASPVGPYFASGLKPVKIWVSTEYHRAAPGGTGAAKTAGNYAASLLPQQEAASRGYDQVCYLDVIENRFLEELGGMNVFAVRNDGSILTPAVTGTILEGGTRSSIITLLHDSGREVFETQIAVDDLVKWIQTGEVTEMFACGTAAVVTPIGELGGENFKARPKGGEVTQWIYDELTGIQNGTRPDKYGWLYRLV
ncbi:branched-chain-amino-acid transaminase [Gleimia coleocanis DSM 15436]|uniref:branched-chain-amino-acid transaminase n=1 Tax=Gleimia coleocanis DSM 15436 TaxID=525245 RepID=C0W141_9ACTO|nr:branched-chain amino acid aminotransferase [Gleimia coleocanis]EEH63530.1 branched-chain-amino-acid transaminase [Gleimia coleocanis DSM 15436]